MIVVTGTTGQPGGLVIATVITVDLAETQSPFHLAGKCTFRVTKIVEIRAHISQSAANFHADVHEPVRDEPWNWCAA